MIAMAVTRIGTAGIPISTSRPVVPGVSGTEQGIRRVRELGLDAMEIEFVRGVYLSPEKARSAGEAARENSVALSVHAPYFINLASTRPGVLDASIEMIRASMDRAELMKASQVTIHAGFYAGLPNDVSSQNSTLSTIASGLKTIMSERSWKTKIGIETMGKQKSFGTVDEVIRLSEMIEGVVPTIDFGHVHARGHGCLKTKEDFHSLLSRFETDLGTNHFHCHMTCLKHEDGNEKHHLTFDAMDPDYSLLAEVLRENGFDLTIISESPNIEVDALRFKAMLEGRKWDGQEGANGASGKAERPGLQRFLKS